MLAHLQGDGILITGWAFWNSENRLNWGHELKHEGLLSCQALPQKW
jgi:hypothetical protein